jgi:sec-independent protein translocase protein TatB
VTGINAYEFVILVVLALVILGPERLPQYARNLARWVRQARDMAEDAKGRFKDETGTDFDDVDWKRYDPRQYDPRRIIREALSDEYSEDFREARTAVTGTLDSARKATDPRELFRSSKPSGRTPAGGVPASTASGAAGSAVAAGMAGAGSREGAERPAAENPAAENSAPENPVPEAASVVAPFDTEAT